MILIDSGIVKFPSKFEQKEKAFSFSNCHEELRHMFVNFKGKKDLTVTRRDLNFYTMKSEDWEEFFPEFVTKISQFTGEEITETITHNITTTTPVSLAVGQLTGEESITECSITTESQRNSIVLRFLLI